MLEIKRHKKLKYFILTIAIASSQIIVTKPQQLKAHVSIHYEQLETDNLSMDPFLHEHIKDHIIAYVNHYIYVQEVKRLKELEQTLAKEKEQVQQVKAQNNSIANEVDEETFFDDAIFIGDSRVDMLGLYIPFGKAKFYAYSGLSVKTALKKDWIKLDDETFGNVLDGAKQHPFKRVYLQFGLNELGWESLDIFKECYRDIITGIRTINSNADIYIMANFPVYETKDHYDKEINNARIQEFNEVIQELASEENAHYIDLFTPFVDENGSLPKDASNDGIHFDIPYLKLWKEQLLSYGYGDHLS